MHPYTHHMTMAYTYGIHLWHTPMAYAHSVTHTHNMTFSHVAPIYMGLQWLGPEYVPVTFAHPLPPPLHLLTHKMGPGFRIQPAG